jgi:pyridoxine 5-phosphate synthase
VLLSHFCKENTMSKTGLRLGVNIDHVATLRQARGTSYPDPVQAAQIAEKAGAHGITLHLREDRRHIQDGDLSRLLKAVAIPVNLEMAVTEEMIKIALAAKPAHICLVPEKREELTTEGGLDVLANQAAIADACARLANAGMEVSLFIDPDMQQIKAAKSVGAPVIELHTGTYADVDVSLQAAELTRLEEAAQYAAQLGLVVNAGHGLTLDNLSPICNLSHLNELNIGHALIADAVFLGLEGAVKAYLLAIH